MCGFFDKGISVDNKTCFLDMLYAVGNNEFYAPIYHIARDAIGFIFVYDPGSRESFEVVKEFHRLIRELRPRDIDCRLPIFIHLVAVSSGMFSASEHISNGERMTVEPGPKDSIPFNGVKASRPGVHLRPKEPDGAVVNPSINQAPEIVTRQEGIEMAQLWECQFFEMSSQGTRDLERLLQWHVRGIKEAPRIAKSDSDFANLSFGTPLLEQRGPKGEVCEGRDGEEG
ncbi:hypothetical protein FA13DRAFT_683106 [Coprinellus micaceus]|uniref:Uncharacterized protein n=1 Tax=Coprinellus micaceus TaxID=71717 RepID=A0A4Y7T4T7_COPMI|nr:hypothetical protein FA13DRAFT_683106 [Coprinellus micaceus]